MSKRKEKEEDLKQAYKDIAGLIEKHAYSYHVYDDEYPHLIIKDDTHGGWYSIEIKKIK